MSIPYPSQLLPTSQEHILLPSGRVVDIPKATPTFEKWEGEPIKNTFGGKPLISVNEKPVFAELAILHLFLDSGWSGRWVETYGAKKALPYYFSSWDDKSLKDQINDPLPNDRDWDVLKKITEAHGGHSGFWDVMAWNESNYTPRGQR
ncbi:hypothetical protein BH24DEI2_BH24DEI2_19040 [soil metagenome]